MYSDGDNASNSNVRVLALIWTYPELNFILISYTANSRWVYDLMLLMVNNAHPRVLRQQFNVFVCALMTFCIMMYLFYVISLPVEDNYDDINNVFAFIAIFQFICAAILSCSIILYIKRIRQLNPAYGRAVLFESIVLISANMVSGVFNIWLARGELMTLMYDRDNKQLFVFTATIVPYFALTEFLPSLVIASTLARFSKIIAPINNEDRRNRQEAAVARVVADMRRQAPRNQQAIQQPLNPQE